MLVFSILLIIFILKWGNNLILNSMKKTILLLVLLICFFTAVNIVAQPNSPILVEPPKGTDVVILPVTVVWQTVNGADCYLVEYTTDTTSNDKEEDTCNAYATSHTIPVTETELNTTYYWRVTAHDASGWGQPSAYFYFTTASTTVTGSIENLTDGVIDLIADLKISQNQGNILISILEQAQYRLGQGNNFLATVNMYYFKLRVMILRISGMISVADANSLNYSADGVIDLIADLDSKPFSINEKELTTPKTYTLGQNYPNPFNPSTTIEYSIPQNSDVSLKIYDMLGKEVASLVSGYKETGTYIVNWDASHLSSGVYFYKLVAGSYILTKKMILSK